SALLRLHPQLGSRLERRLALVEMMYHVGLGSVDEEPTSEETLDSVTYIPCPSDAPTVDAAQTQFLPETGFVPRDLPGYEVLSLLGRGGMGVVYKARQKSLNRIVALKMIRAHANPELLARFHIEAEALASLQHPNIVQICDYGEIDGCPYMAMEFV